MLNVGEYTSPMDPMGIYLLTVDPMGYTCAVIFWGLKFVAGRTWHSNCSY